MWNNFETWARVMGVVLIVLGVADLLAFGFELKAHGWSLAAKFELVGLVVLLVLGLGDWHLQTLAAAHDEAMRVRIQSAEADAATAKDESSKADRASQAAKQESDAAKAENADLRKQIAPFVEIAHGAYPNLDAKAGLARLSAEIGAIRERTEALERKTAQRSLSPQQESAIAAALRHSGAAAVTVGVKYPAESEEATAYADAIAEAIRAGGWKVTETAVMQGALPDGLFVFVHDPNHPPTIANVLAGALLAAHVQVRGGNDAGVPEGSIEVRVGHRPAN